MYGGLNDQFDGGDFSFIDGLHAGFRAHDMNHTWRR